MNEANKYWTGAFGNLRVPFEPKIIFLGFLAIMIFMGGVTVINLFAEQDHLVTRSFYAYSSFLGKTAEQGFRLIYGLLPGNKVSEKLLTQSPGCNANTALLIWVVLVWALFSGAINRIIAFRIAKEDSISTKAALKFSWRYKYSLFLSPFLIGLLIGIFYGCNWFAGYMAKILPVAGPVIFVPVFFLVLLSTLFMMMLLIGIVFGFHMISSGVATESCDGGEAFINVLTYIYSRPWSYIFYHIMIIVSVIVILWMGGVFIDVAFESSLVSKDADIQRYKLDDDYKGVKVFKGKEENYRYYYLEKGKTEYDIALTAFNKKYTTEAEREKYAEERPLYYPDIAGMKDVWAYIQATPTESRYDKFLQSYEADKKNQHQHAMRFNDIWHLDKYWACIALAMFIFYMGLNAIVWGYAFAYLCAASTTVYFMLRKEVEGTDFEEIWEEEDEPAPPAKIKKKKSKTDKKVKTDKVNNEKVETAKVDKAKTDDKKVDKAKTDDKKDDKAKTDDKKDDKAKTDDKKDDKAKIDDKKDDKAKIDDKKDDKAKTDDKKDDKAKTDDKKDDKAKIDDKKDDKGKDDKAKDDKAKIDDKKDDKAKIDDKKDDKAKIDDKKVDKGKDDKAKDDKGKDDKAKDDKAKDDKAKDDDLKQTQAKKITKSDEGTMAIPLIRRRSLEKKDNKDNKDKPGGKKNNQFMD